MQGLKLVRHSFLRPLSIFWEMLYRFRRFLYEYGVFKKEYFKVPIISVGNITFGGTGKTPTIVWLSKLFESKKLTPMILTRGYKGDFENKSGLIKGGQRFRSNPQVYGDEPLLIARNIKKGSVVVGKRRAENLKKYFHQVLPDVVLLDDGFQHLKLHRSLNIVLFDALMDLNLYYTAPYGYLREGWSALKDADIILITRADQVQEMQLEKLMDLIKGYTRKGIPFCKLKYNCIGLYNSYDTETFVIDDLKGQKAIVVSALASPKSFYRSLEDFGVDIHKRFEFPDHHIFTKEEMLEIVELATQEEAIIITTEKDIVKIKRIIQEPLINYLKIDLSFISGEEEVIKKINKVLSLDSL
jgi:tetraacyldisaccharide 4'-kinase